MVEKLGVREGLIAAALADVAMPSGGRLAPASEATVRALSEVLSQLGPPTSEAYPYLLRSLDLLARARTARGFVALPLGERVALLRELEAVPVSSLVLHALLTPIRIARTRELMQADAGIVRRSLPVAVERPRWSQRTLDARSFTHGEQLEADVVVVGTGAGGAAVAKALSVRGHAVLMIEEGGLYTRADFQGDVLARQRKLYRPMTLALGNTVIPVPTGISVGGTTTINSGTCFRPPSEVLRRFRFEHGLTELDEALLEPYFARVEAMLEVGPTPSAWMSASERMIARGAEVLGFPHAPLWRNAPGCDGQSECCFGCPTDAKRSTNVSYVPAALNAGAMLVYHACVERILVEHGKAVGVTALSARTDGAPPVRIMVRAKAVVLACGSFETPALLLRNGLCNSSGELGKHLSLHPASHAWARFDHALEGPKGVPQGHCVELPGHDGIRIEGGFPPKELAVTTLMQWGDELTSMIERFEQLAFCGFMIRDDHARGRVALDARGKPRVSYWLDEADQRKVVLGHVALAKLFLAAGARTVFPGIFASAHARLENADDVQRLERAGHLLHARDFALTAFHPLGTCRMGYDPRRYVVGPSHETHDVKSLFVCDGSAVPGPLGVNPQVTIMALSERASEWVERRVEGDASSHLRALHHLPAQNDNAPRAPSKPLDSVTDAPSWSGRSLRFAETMRGTCHTLFGPRTSRDVVLEVAARGRVQTLLHDLAHEGSTFVLEGALHVKTFADHAACRGTLTMAPRELARALVYDLSFLDANGTPCRLYGEKRLAGVNPLAGMTTLYIEISRGEPSVPMLRGVLRFELAALWPWLRSFRTA